MSSIQSFSEFFSKDIAMKGNKASGKQVIDTVLSTAMLWQTFFFLHLLTLKSFQNFQKFEKYPPKTTYKSIHQKSWTTLNTLFISYAQWQLQRSPTHGNAVTLLTSSDPATGAAYACSSKPHISLSQQTGILPPKTGTSLSESSQCSLHAVTHA